MTLSQRYRRHWLFAIFVLSGFAGLIYQSIWSHYLGLFLGHAAYAQALVLAIFMGGMAAGSAWIAHAGQSWRNLIRSYALIEAVIGLCALLFHTAFGNVASFSYDWLIPALKDPWTVNLARWIVAALLILPQTILLGMTFPLMSGGMIRRYPGSEGHALGGLYFTNSIGAAAGALVAVFVLLPWIGLPGAMIAAGLLNFVVAGLAWWLAREPEHRPTNTAKSAKDQSLSHNPLLRLVLISTALSGAASFAYEIIWIRMLSMAVGSTIHAFELMLASFIAGIALGGLWVRKHADSTDSPLRLVGWMQVFMGVAALASLAVYANAFTWVGWLIQALAKSDAGYSLFNLGTATTAIAIMLPAAFFAGTTLPLFTVVLLRDGLGERSIGRVYAWNTLGSIAGVFAAIHFLIPALGLKLALCIAALVDIGIGLGLLRMQADTPKAMARFGMGLGLAAVALIASVRIPFDPTTMASGVFRHGRTSLQQGDKVLYYKDGKTTSVAAVLSDNGNLHISTNGKTDAAIQMDDAKPASLDEPTMAMLAALPLSMHQSPKRVGVIGFGSGLTTHTLLGDARIDRVDTIEIESAMVQGARAFGPRVERAFNDPRSNIIVDDAKSYFSGQNSQYDIIISEPSNPWISGVGTLFSKEFYQFVPRHLNKGGLFVQWVQLYEIDDVLLGSILKALTPAFEDYSAFLSNQSDLLIIASPKGALPPLNPSPLLLNPASQADLRRVGIDNAQQLNFRRIADARMLKALSELHPKQPTNSDFYPVLSLEAPKARFKNSLAETTQSLPVVNRQLLGALGIEQALPADIEPSHLQHFAADTLTLRARGIAKEMRGEITLFSPAVESLRAAARACDAPWSLQRSRQLAASINDLADRTIPYLPPSLLHGVWIHPQWTPCIQKLPPDLKRALSLLEAHAKRDYAQMEMLGNDWIKNRPQDEFLKTSFDGYAWSGVVLALIQQQKWDQIPSALDTETQKVQLGSEHLFLHSIAHALAKTAKQP